MIKSKERTFIPIRENAKETILSSYAEIGMSQIDYFTNSLLGLCVIDEPTRIMILAHGINAYHLLETGQELNPDIISDLARQTIEHMVKSMEQDNEPTT